MAIYGENSYLGHIFQDVGQSVIPKYSNIHIHCWLTATHTPQNIRFVRAGAVPEHKIIPHIAAIPGFQTEMATKRQNLRTAALNNGHCFIKRTFRMALFWYLIHSSN